MNPGILREDGDRTLRFVKNEGFIGLRLGVESLSTTEDWNSAYLLKVFARIDAEEKPTARVAHLGGGMGWLAKMLLGYGYHQDIYEIDPDVVVFLQGGILSDKVRFFTGDWKNMLEGEYDIIIYDVDEPLAEDQEQFVRQHLAENGLFLKPSDY